MACIGDNKQDDSKQTDFVLTGNNNTYICRLTKFMGRGSFKTAYLVKVINTFINDFTVQQIPVDKMAVVKIQNKGRITNPKGWSADVEDLSQLRGCCARWNKQGKTSKKMYANTPLILMVASDFKSDAFQLSFKRGDYVMVEPPLENFEKFNHPFRGVSIMKNGGGKNKDELVALSIQAFSHWTYHESGATWLFCDMQGSREKDAYYLTDPLRISAIQNWKAVREWFSKHTCNKFCHFEWMIPMGMDKKQLNPFQEAHMNNENQNKTQIPPTKLIGFK